MTVPGAPPHPRSEPVAEPSTPAKRPRRRATYQELRRRVVALGIATAIAVTAWLGFLLLKDAPRFNVEYVVAWHTSLWWAALCLTVGVAASLGAGGVLIGLLVVAIRQPFLKATVGLLAVLAWIAGAVFLALISFFILLAVGLEGHQTFLTAEDGTSLMITQDGFDGDSVDFYDPGPGWTWIRRRETAGIDPRDGPCSLTTTVSLLTVTCGAQTQSLPRS